MFGQKKKGTEAKTKGDLQLCVLSWWVIVTGYNLVMHAGPNR